MELISDILNVFFQIQRGKLTTLVNKFMWVSRVFGILYISGITLERMHVYAGAKVREDIIIVAWVEFCEF